MYTRRTHPWIHFALVPAAIAALGLSAQTPAFAAGTGSAAQAATSQHSNAAAQERAADRSHARASRLIGTDVVNGKGQQVGEITDLVVDLSSGQLRYAIMSFDPGILSAEKLFAVPPAQLRVPPGQHQVVYDVDKERLEQAAIERSDWTSRFFTDEDKVARLDKAWDLKQPSEKAVRAYRVSDLIGKDVNDRNGTDIGEVEDVVVDTARHTVHHALLDLDADWADPDRRYPVELQSLRLSGDRDEAVLDVAQERLEKMKGIEVSELNDSVRTRELYNGATGMPGTVGHSPTMAATTAQFSRMDTNDDGWLTREEARLDGELDGDWSALDRDGNDRISRQEFAAAHSDRMNR